MVGSKNHHIHTLGVPSGNCT